MGERKLQNVLKAITELKDDVDNAQKKLDILISGHESLHEVLRGMRFGSFTADEQSYRDCSVGMMQVLTTTIPGSIRVSRFASSTDAWPASILMREGLAMNGSFSDDRANSRGTIATKRQSAAIAPIRIPSVSLWLLTSAIEPNSTILTVLHSLGILALLNDIIVTPFVLAWDLPMARSIWFLAGFAALYWTCDMIVHFRTGYFRHGELNMNKIDIIHHYLRGAFMLDLVLVVYDWLFLVSSAVQQIMILRLLRIVKIFRIVRLVKLMDNIAHWSSSSTWAVSVLVFKVFASVLILNHLISCAWFLVGTRLLSDTGKRWTSHTPFPWEQGYDFMHMNVVYQYVLTNHWITAEMTLAGVHIEPANSAEGIISTFLLIWGLLVGGTIAGVFSSKIVEIQEAQREKIEQLATLRNFLSERKVDPRLAYIVRKQAESRLNASAPLVEDNVVALELISSSLRAQLLRSMRSPHLLSHSLFQAWKHLQRDSVRMLCEQVALGFFSPKDVLFEEEKPSNSAYYLVGKRMLYSKMSLEGSPFEVPEDITSTVDQGSWLCESAWWSQWVHVGTCEALTPCQVLVVSAKSLLAIARSMPSVAQTTKDYGSKFYIRIVSAQPPYSTFPDDLHVPFTDPSDLLSNGIGIEILKKAQKEGILKLSAGELDEFESEILQGKCALQQKSDDGSLERVVAVAAVRLARDDGHVFVQVGKWDPFHSIKPCCLLPGTKRKNGELPQDSMSRILDTDLSVFKGGMVVGKTTTDMFMKEAKWGVRTKYLRTECHATLQRGFKMPDFRVEKPSQPLTHLPVPPRDVYILKDGDRKLRDKKLLFAWLSEKEFKRASLPGNEHVLVPWLSLLDIPADGDILDDNEKSDEDCSLDVTGLCTETFNASPLSTMAI